MSKSITTVDYIKESGYDGLFCEETGCWCSIDQIESEDFLCEKLVNSDCQAGVKQNCASGYTPGICKVCGTEIEGEKAHIGEEK